MYRAVLLKGTGAGILGGIALGLFLKLCEWLTGIRVYTLLLNVDYVSILDSFEFTEIGDFILHLIVSVPLAIFLFWLAAHRNWQSRVIWKMVWLCMLIGLLLYPLTVLSDRTPALDFFPAVLLWLAGHAVYGGVLGVMFRGRIGTVT